MPVCLSTAACLGSAVSSKVMDALAHDVENIINVVIYIFVTNFYVIAIILYNGEQKNQSILFLASSALAHISLGISLVQQITLLFSKNPRLDRQTLQLCIVIYVTISAMPALGALNLVLVKMSHFLDGPFFSLGVVQTNFVPVNLSYARRSGSRLVAAVMVASPWLYGVFIPMPFIWTARLNGDSALVIVAALFTGHVFPGMFAWTTAIADSVNFWKAKNACEKEGHRPASTHPGEDSGVSSEQHPRVETSSADVTGAVRFPKAEVIVTAVFIYVVVFTSCFAVAVSSAHNDVKGGLANLVLILWPSVFAVLCLLRSDFTQTFFTYPYRKTPSFRLIAV